VRVTVALSAKPYTASTQHQAVYSQGGLDARHIGQFVHQKDIADFSHAQFDEVAMEWPIGSCLAVKRPTFVH
jgi:hypothetical protein